MLEKSFMFGCLFAFSLLNNVTATGGPTAAQLGILDRLDPYIIGLGTTISPDVLATHSGLNPEAVSSIPGQDATVRIHWYENILVSHYLDKNKCNQPETYYVYGVDKRNSVVRALQEYATKEAKETLGNDKGFLTMDFSAKAVAAAVPVPWNSIKGWWIVSPSHNPEEFHENRAYHRLLPSILNTIRTRRRTFRLVMPDRPISSSDKAMETRGP
ncbi:uncharacterized protein PgNI_04059 [Pyricularia grisea]|uniref:Uncharacterized protein n=1 Tax=Pyricularia grisea TaxID=148305 RepID=A0A6P8B8N6_PYRGI|nr:uncharacterized protein PgNI_04059 [Pyricularia grisea]TLD12156.1 hypothetical protein PgNI_04059 [Pyricularia grisea]